MAMRTVHITEELYERVKAAADGRTFSGSLARMLVDPTDRNVIIDQWLDLTTLAEVQRRWHRVTTKGKVRLDGR
jgi:predicted CopG family antitoxin